MGEETLLKILNTGMGIEKEGAKKYMEWAKKAKDVSAKDMFIQLAREELDHLELFERFSKNIKEGKDEKIETPRSEIAKVVDVLKNKEGRKGEQATPSEQDALRMALKLEENSAKYYAEKAEEVDDEKAKDLLKALEHIEWKHYEMIKFELDRIGKTGHWMDFREFTLE